MKFIRLKECIALVPRASVSSPPVVSIVSIFESSSRRTAGGGKSSENLEGENPKD